MPHGEKPLQIANALPPATLGANNGTRGECTATSQGPQAASGSRNSFVPTDERVCLSEVVDSTLPEPRVSEKKDRSQYVPQPYPRVQPTSFEHPSGSVQDSSQSLVDIARESLSQQPVVASLPQSGTDPSQPCVEVPATPNVKQHSHNRNVTWDQVQSAKAAPISHFREGVTRPLPIEPKLYGNDTIAPRTANTKNMAPIEAQQILRPNDRNQLHYEALARQRTLPGDQLRTPTSLPSVKSQSTTGRHHDGLPCLP